MTTEPEADPGPKAEAPPSAYFAFEISAAFPKNSVVGEWVATVSVAFNDLALVHVRLREDEDQPEKHFYWLRVALAHLLEILKYLDATKDVPDVAAFVSSLPDDVVARYRECLEAYSDETKKALHKIRDQATFHYPELSALRGKGPTKRALSRLQAEKGVIRAGKVSDARLLYADDVIALIFIDASGGETEYEAVHERIRDSITSFMRFANPMTMEYLYRSGAVMTPVEPVDPTNLRGGWKEPGK